MSVRLDAVGDYLASNAHQPSQTAHTFFMWAKFISTTAADRKIMVHYDVSSTQQWQLYRDSAGVFRFRANGTGSVATATAPTWTSWFAMYFIVNSTTVTCGWRQEGGGAWVTNTGTAATFTTFGNDAFRIGDGFTTADMEVRYMRQWDSALAESDMTNEFNSTTIVTATPLRNCALATGATAGTDSSANAYNLVATNSGGGSLTDGASEPAIAAGTVQKAIYFYSMLRNAG